jgi:L-alanine-DL-glutamate epimerase-like enolase superfamily enzyme
MRITSITGYRQDQPFRDGPYICSGGRSALGFDSIICAIATDAGITGWGEMAPLSRPARERPLPSWPRP